jgi:hypothetical protein
MISAKEPPIVVATQNLRRRRRGFDQQLADSRAAFIGHQFHGSSSSVE